MSHLTLIPPTEPDEKQAVLERVKRMDRPPGIVQCKKCGGRDTMTVVSGSYVDSTGKLKRGTVTAKNQCYHCDKRGVLSFMLSDPPRIAKPLKPRRTKPKAVK